MASTSQSPRPAVAAAATPAQAPAQAQAQAPAAAQEFVVRVPQVTNKKYTIMKFGRSREVDFTKCGQAALARENNLKEFKQANDLDQMPKFGAGSEYGRERRDIARKKKYGVMLKNYRVDEQPWQLKIGKGKESKKYKGTREGGILENASYYIFSKCPDGAFEAHPVEEWYNFNPVINYKFLNSEEAEEEFSRRDKTLNYFSIMLKKRINNEDDADLDGEGSEAKNKSKGKGKKKKKSELMLTDMDDWAALSDDEIAESDEEEDEGEKSKKAKPPKKGKKRKERKNSEDEAMEESDDMDEGQEVDYMTDTDSEDEDMYNQEGREKLDKYEEKGVADEEGLRKQLDSDEEDEEEEKKEEENQDEEIESKKGDINSDSSSSSDSDSDEEKEEDFSSALFMPKKKEKSGRSTPLNKVQNSEGSKSRTPTPTEKKSAVAGLKRKGDNRKSTLPKKSKTESPVPQSEGAKSEEGDKTADVSKKNTFIPINCEGISEDAVRRYLIRKPMTTKDLLQKFKSKKTGLSNEQLVNAIVTILKKINPEKQSIDGKMHLYLKPE